MSYQIQEIIDEINNAANKIRKSPPQIVIDIFKHGIIKNKAGTRGQFFSTLVFIQGVCRSLAYDCVNNLIYMFDEDAFNREQLAIMIPKYLRSNANFLGYCGFDHVWQFAKTIINNLELVETRAQLKELIHAYNYYLANLYTWVHHYFPWHLGNQFPLPNTYLANKDFSFEESANL